MIRVLCFVLFLGLAPLSLLAQTNDFGVWMEFELKKKIFKDLDFSIIPDIRLQDNFKVDKYQIDGKLSYSPWERLEFAGAYRIKTNVRNKGNVTTHRFVFDASLKEDVGRFDLALRTRYTNYSDENERKNPFVRPRFKLTYDIKNKKITPYASYELFRNLSDKEWQKGRFDIGARRKLGKIHRVGLYYRLQDYFNDRNSIHIVGVDYRIRI